MIKITIDILKALPVNERAKEILKEIDLLDFYGLQKLVNYIEESEISFESILELNDFLLFNSFIDTLLDSE